MIVIREFRFEAAHKLPNYNGNCSKLHGHSYKLEVAVKGKVKNGMVIDFRELDSIVKEKVISILDHSYLNDTIKNPTAENIVKYIWNKLKPLNLHLLRLWETEKSSVIYNGK
ncbi:6-carboxytetrahydropterin synthase QueD [Candidatus Woesearchaeota archaeon]|nr:6-carboxytetrahydropterin synthase QueD [Candidatus Woesearchaeota archaeon]